MGSPLKYMKNFLTICALIVLSTVYAAAQKPKPRPKAAPKVAAVKQSDTGTVSGRTYTNPTYNFQVTFPDSWLIPDKDFEKYMLTQGIDLRIKMPPNSAAKTNGKFAPINLVVLLTAYSALPGTPDASTARISVENLKALPQVKDAVDYFDLMRVNFQNMKLPADFKYSETQAEKLGEVQFAFIDTSSKTDQRRMYATVREGHALMFTLIYHNAEDLQVLRDALAGGNFKLN